MNDLYKNLFDRSICENYLSIHGADLSLSLRAPYKCS